MRRASPVLNMLTVATDLKRLSVLADEIGGGADVFDAVLRFVGVARCAAACALVGGVKGDGQIALFGKFLRVQACHLLFHAAVGVRHHDGRVFFVGVKIGGRVHIGGNFNAGLFLHVFDGVE